MDWSSALPEAFPLPNGKKVATLADAANLILRLPKARQADDRWVEATRSLMRAAEYPFPHQIEKANLALWRAMRAEKMSTAPLPARPRA